MTKILVVDDDVSVRTATTVLLELHDFEVIAADGGKAALAMEGIGACDLALIDLFMPGMDGLETLKALRARWPKLHAIMVSGFGAAAAGPDLLHMATEIAACRGLSKPFTPAQLLDCIDECVGAAARNRQSEARRVA